MSPLIGRIKGVGHFLTLQGIQEFRISANLITPKQCSNINKKEIFTCFASTCKLVRS